VLAWVICLGRGADLHMAQLTHCHSLSLDPVNPDWFYLSGTGSPCSPGQRAGKRLLGHLLRDDLINLVKLSVRPSIRAYVRTSIMKHNAATNQIVVFVRVDETFTTI